MWLQNGNSQNMKFLTFKTTSFSVQNDRNLGTSEPWNHQRSLHCDGSSKRDPEKWLKSRLENLKIEASHGERLCDRRVTDSWRARWSFAGLCRLPVELLSPHGHVVYPKMIVFSVSGPLEIPNDWCIMNERRIVVEMVTEKLHFREISKLSLFPGLKWCFSLFLCYAGPIGLFEDEEPRNNLVYGPGKRSF